MWDALVGFFEHLMMATNPLWLYYPLCAIVAVVYKATKFDDPRQIARAALHFFVSVTIGMLVLGVVLYLVSRLF
ncbi:MAG: hypothetical protein IMZ62_01830 [Chloroflexi bacterium]|nr:hypothetical protein [Chloroflexota bacterium]